jgi:hypothetical protein
VLRFGLHAFGHCGLVALCEPHDEREPTAAAKVSMRALERSHDITAAHDRAGGVRARFDLFFRRARGEHRHEVVEHSPRIGVAGRG